MKTTLTILLVCAVLQVVCVSLSTGEDLPATAAPGTTTPTEINCTALDTKDLCCKESSCVFINCTAVPQDITGCFSNGTDSNCTDPTEDKDTCDRAPTDECRQHSNSTIDCCNATGCGFYNCTKAGSDSESVCAANSTELSSICEGEGYSPVNITCQDEVITTVNPITTLNTTVEPTKPTTNPSSATTSENPTQAPSTGGETGQHFDAASFIGGIVLCAGLAAIAYFGFKFYKARTERNYHTL